jgi:type I restriction enzyme S subunit
VSLNTTDYYWSLIQDRWHARVHLKWRAKIFSGATPSRDNAEYWAEGIHPWIGSGEVNQGLVTEPTALISDLAVQKTSTKLMRKGALIIALAGQGRTKGTVAQLGIDCFGNQSLSCIDARTDDDRFLFWWLTSLYRQIRGLASDDSRDGLNQEMVGSIPIPIVEIHTQRITAYYLDRETARINGLIAEKERMLALLDEKRAALISRVVTRGLDPNAPLKPSGQEWLGEIPAHWGLQRLKQLAEVRGGLTLGKQYSGELLEYPYLRVANVQDGYLKLDDILTVEVPAPEAASNLLAYGDVLMNEGGDIDKLGRGCVWRDEIAPCLHQNHVFAVRPHSVDSDWLALWTSTLQAKRYFESRAKRSTNLASISGSNIKELPVPLPPIADQLAIRQFLADRHSHFDAVRKELRDSLRLLSERRAALITAAVTGQIPLEEMTA